VEAAARKYDVDPLLVHSVIQVESNYNPYAVSPKGAQGLMQLMPGTARRFGVSNSFDPAENIDGGVRYLKYLSTLFPQDPRLAIAAYNAGEGAVWKYNFQIPPYRETEHYVSRVSERYGKARRKAQEVKAPASEHADGDAVKAAMASAPAAPSYASVEAYVDADGRLHLRTGSGRTSTP
jgi:soluble lytic murein transglycosylase-like protein